MIINREVECVIIEENEEALAVLDINPISEGHTIIIPKSPSNSSKEISSKVFELSQRIATLIKNNLKAENVDIQTESKFGESIVNVIPSYKSHVSLNSERKKSSFDELRNVLKKMKPEEKPKTLRIKKSTAQLEIVKRERRIP